MESNCHQTQTPWTPEPIGPVPLTGIRDPEEGSLLLHLLKTPTNNAKKGVASIATNKDISLETVRRRRRKIPRHAKLKLKTVVKKVKLNQLMNQLVKNLATLSSALEDPCLKKER